MRLSYLHAMSPLLRMGTLATQFPPGSRKKLFDLCTPGEYERLLKGVPSNLAAIWSADMTSADRAAWKRYSILAQKEEARVGAILDVLRPRLARALSARPYDVDTLSTLPRLLGDAVDTAGVRLYWRREALGGNVSVFERVVPLEGLVESVARLQRWGAAPFVTLHDIPYGVARTNANVRAARVFAVDWDEKHEQHPPTKLLDTYPPDLFVRTGAGFHAYWRIPDEERDTLGLTHWRRTALALARALNADTDAVLGTQLMRLPGAIHLKDPSNPRPVYVLDTYDGPPRRDVTAALTRAYNLQLRDEDVLNTAVSLRTISIAPEEHPALAHLLSQLEDQGLCPQPDNQGWAFFCPVHEVERVFGADLDDGSNQQFIPRSNSTPSGVLRVNEDRSLKFFCGSTQRCGAGPRDLLEYLGLDPGLTWLECGGFLRSDYGKRWKAARVADGTWRGVSPATQESWAKLTGI